MANIPELHPEMVHAAWWRHESRDRDPEYGNVMDRYVALHPRAQEFAGATWDMYLAGVTPHLVVSSDIPRAALTAAYACPGSQIVIDQRLGCPEGDDVWNKAFLDVPWTATGKECFDAASKLVITAAIRVRCVLEDALTRTPLGGLVCGFGHAPTMDTVRAMLEGEMRGTSSPSWSGVQFGSGAFVLGSYRRSEAGALTLMSARYCPAYRPAP